MFTESKPEIQAPNSPINNEGISSTPIIPLEQQEEITISNVPNLANETTPYDESEKKNEVEITLNNELEEIETFNFDDWYRDHVVSYKLKKRVVVTDVPLPIVKKRTAPTPVFSKAGADFLDVVLGGGNQSVTQKHFNAFLKQAGGSKVKITQRGYQLLKFDDTSVETTYILPNLSYNWESTPFVLCHVHLPHSASDPFPRKTLYNFIKRDLLSAGYTKEKLGLD